MPTAAPQILFLSHDSGRTGAPIGLLAFLRWLRANTDYGIATILRTPGPLEADFRALGPTLTLGTSPLLRSRGGRRLHRLLPGPLRQETAKIKKFFAAGRFDLIYANTVMNGGVLASLVPTRIPIITHVHELEFWISRTANDDLRRVFDHTSAFIAVAEAVRTNLVQKHGLPAEKISVIYEHIRDLPRVPTESEKHAARAALGVPAEAFVVGGCGAEHWRKGRDLIPQLLVHLRRLSPQRPIHFVWIGRNGSAAEEAALAHDLRAAGIESLFHSSGEVENPFRLFPALDVFALLSRDDPYPLAALEVAATETPLVCFQGSGGMPEFVRNDCGLAAPYLDLDAMASALLRLASDPALRAAHGRNSRRKVTAENLVETTGPLLLATIEKQLAAHRAAAAN